mmetsp:Transcript_11335/g.39495  ORF Transcript_11335/g.39495 Transcript_11335/m.39495 type:complete len:503 (-) Transcript_11335:180-1688(-)
MLTSIARTAAKRSSRIVSAARAADPPRRALSGLRERVNVHKFGGSSVGSAEAMVSVADILSNEQRESGAGTVGVLSAMYGVTNRLVEGAAAGRRGDAEAVARLKDELWTVHHGVVHDIIDDQEQREDALRYVERCLGEQFEETALATATADDGSSAASARAGDLITSVGERLSTRLVAGHLASRGVKSTFMESDRVIVTDGRPGDATPDVARTTERAASALVPELNKGNLVLMTGFYGAAPDGEVNTLGRGGSDLSATLMGGVLDAETVTLWKVECEKHDNGWMARWRPGFEGVVHDEDKKHVLPSLDYQEATELAHFGKAVLHPSAMMPVSDKGIPVRIRNTLDVDHHGTTIRRIEHRVESSGSESESDGDLINWLAPTTITSISNAKYAGKWGADALPSEASVFDEPLAINTEDASDRLRFMSPDGVMVALVGKGICGDGNMLAERIARRASRVLRRAGVPCVVPRRLNGSSSNLTLIVGSAAEAEAARRVLHETLVRKA